MENTPRREKTKDRHSLEGKREELDAPSPKSPLTPSPPNNKGRRSSVLHGFLPSPLPAAGSKRHSGIDFANPESPSVKTRLLPPTTPKTRNSELFLSPSPKLKSPGVYKENEKPIREISNSLKTRLNYAFVKLQNGWVDKTLPELENKDGPAEPSSTSSSKHRVSYSNRFLDDDESDSNSARAAFLNALTSPKKKQRQNSMTSPARSGSPGKIRPPPISTKPKEPPSEVEAIETLMSLSSPKSQSRKKSAEFTLPPPPPLSQRQASQTEQPATSHSSRSSSSDSSAPNTLAKPFLLKSEAGESSQIVLDVETDVEETNDD
ncbi:hypothetical protein ACU8KH_02623 [Lachancea thermotolerans]